MRLSFAQWIILTLFVGLLAGGFAGWKIAQARSRGRVVRDESTEWMFYVAEQLHAHPPNVGNIEYGLVRLRALLPKESPLLASYEAEASEVKTAVAAHQEVMKALEEAESDMKAGLFAAAAARLHLLEKVPGGKSASRRMGAYAYDEDVRLAMGRIRGATESIIKDPGRSGRLEQRELDALWAIEFCTRLDSRIPVYRLWSPDSRPFDSPEFLENLRGTPLPEIDIHALSAPGVRVSNAEDGVVLENSGEETARIILKSDVSWSDYLLRLQVTPTEDGFAVEQRVSDVFRKPVRHDIKSMMGDAGPIRPAVRATLELLVSGNQTRASFGSTPGVNGSCDRATANVGGCAILLPPHARLTLHKVEVKVFRYGPR